MTNLISRLESFNKLNQQNALRALDTESDIKNVLIQNSVQMISKAIENNNQYIFPMVKVVPTSQNLLNNIFTSDIALFTMYLSQLSYKIDIEVPFDSTPTGFKKVSDFLLRFLPPGSVVVKPLVYNCLNIISKTNTWGGFILEFNGATFIILRGTSYPCEVYEDEKFYLTTPDWLKTVKVHSGFNNMYSTDPLKDKIRSLRNQIWSYLNLKGTSIKKLFLCGHSLGGGILTLLLAELSFVMPNLRIITNAYLVGTPYVGNINFVNTIMKVNTNKNYTGIFSIINTRDLVPTKSVFYYERVPFQLFCFTNRALTIIESHSLDKYRIEVEKPEISKIFNDNALKRLASCGPLSCDDTGSKNIEDEKTKSKNKNMLILIITILIIIFIIFLYFYMKK
jgi:hypothetical protein